MWTSNPVNVWRIFCFRCMEFKVCFSWTSCFKSDFDGAPMDAPFRHFLIVFEPIPMFYESERTESPSTLICASQRMEVNCCWQRHRKTIECRTKDWVTWPPKQIGNALHRDCCVTITKRTGNFSIVFLRVLDRHILLHVSWISTEENCLQCTGNSCVARWIAKPIRACCYLPPFLCTFLRFLRYGWWVEV